MNVLLRGGRRHICWLTALPIFPDQGKADEVSPNTKTYQAYVQSRVYNQETGWERLKDVFSLE